MQDTYFARCKVYAYITWLVTLALIVGAWVAMFQQPHNWHLAGLLAFTAAMFSAVAATLHIRSFMVRLSSLVRACHGLSQAEPSGDADLHPIR